MLVLLVITSLALVSLDERGSAVINSARTAAQDFVSPLQDLADDVFNPVSDWLDGLGRANELQDQNEKLQRELDAARAEVAAGKADQAELDQLRQSNDLVNVADGEGVTAEVVGQGAGNFSRSLVISKGSSSGIALGQPVVWGVKSKAALVGTIVRVSANRATVQRIDDPGFGAGAELMPTGAEGAKGIAVGQRDSSLLRFSATDSSSTASVPKKGDIAITLGGADDPKYPRGLVIGTVVRGVSAGGAVARNADLRPIIDLDSLTFVKVLKAPVPIP
jgi:rod shape-determining protein MreC